MSLSAIIITFNEEKNIARCLQSLSFCDEKIVVDSKSTDRTLEIAKAYTENIVVKPWMGFTQQRNEALKHTEADWVLSIDADEEVSDELKNEILAAIKSAEKSGTAAFYIPRKTLHSNKWIKHGGWYPNYLLRLFKRNSGQWQGDEVHEYWATSQKTERLKHPLTHYSFTSIADQVNRNNHYSTLLAQRRYKQGTKFRWTKLLFKPYFKFLETYFIKLGFLDGYLGFMIAYSAAYSVFLQWSKLWELDRSEKQKK